MTDKEKYIEEMAIVLQEATCEEDCDKCKYLNNPKVCCGWLRDAEALYNAGYRKEKQGKWEFRTEPFGAGYYCTNCGAHFKGDNAEVIAKSHDFCGKCGARMVGDKE